MLSEKDEYISLLNIEEIRKRIQEFEALDLAVTSEEEIFSTLLRIFIVNRNGKDFFQFSPLIFTVPKNTRFYRIRKDIEFLLHARREDFWDNQDAPQNRFNKPRERVLYVSTRILTAISETGIMYDDYFVLIEYLTIQPLEISASVVNNRYGDENHDHETIRLMNDFMINLAKMNISSSEKFKYKATNALANIVNCFPLDEENNRAGMQYVSAHTGKMENLVIKGDHLNKLAIKNAWLVRKGLGHQADFYRQIILDEDTFRLIIPQTSSMNGVGEIVSIIKT